MKLLPRLARVDLSWSQAKDRPLAHFKLDGCKPLPQPACSQSYGPLPRCRWWGGSCGCLAALDSLSSHGITFVTVNPNETDDIGVVMSTWYKARDWMMLTRPASVFEPLACSSPTFDPSLGAGPRPREVKCWRHRVTCHGPPTGFWDYYRGA